MDERQRGIRTFIIRIIWLVVALVVWIVSLNMMLNASNSENQIMYSGICCIPMILPIGRFVLNLTRNAGNAGAAYWDVDITTSGHLYIHNHRFLWAAVAFVISVALCVVFGIFILPVYWLYFAVCTVIMGFRLFRR